MIRTFWPGGRVVGMVLASALLLGTAFSQSGPLAGFMSPAPSPTAFGKTTAVAGDIDGDGFDDVMVADPEADIGGTDTGSVYIYSGANSAILRTLNGVAAGDRWGTVIDGGVDIDGDGVPDQLIGSPTAQSTGRVEVRSGATGSLIFAITSSTFAGVGSVDSLGLQARFVGDTNLDGVPDIALGVDLAVPPPGIGTTVARVSGATGFYLADRSVPGALVDLRIAACGDIDGDGKADLLIGLPTVGTSRGQVIFATTSVSESSYLGLANNHRLGDTLTGGVDLDGDGDGDVVASAPGYSGGTGRVYALEYPGHVGGALGIVPSDKIFELTGSAVGDAFGRSLALADLNADGATDVIVGAPGNDGAANDAGAIRVHTASSAAPLIASFSGTAPMEQLGSTVVSALLIDGVAVVGGGIGSFIGFYIPSPCVPMNFCCVHAVFVVATSCDGGLMLQNICAVLPQLINELSQVGITLTYQVLGIIKNPSNDPYLASLGLGSCFTTDVRTLLGASVPPVSIPFITINANLGDPCNTFRGAESDWGPASAIVANRYPWPMNCKRLIIPVAAEGPKCGDPHDLADTWALKGAIEQANATSCTVSPILHPNCVGATHDAGRKIADATGGYCTKLTDMTQPTMYATLRRAFTMLCCVPLPAMCVAWYPFDEGSGTLAYDIHHRNDGELADQGFAQPKPQFSQAGLVGGALHFDGVDDYVFVTSPPSGDLDFGVGEDFTIEAWIKLDASAGLMTIAEKLRPTVPPPGETGWRFFLSNGVMGLRLADGTGTNYFASGAAGTVPVDGRWHFVCVSVDRDGGANGIKFFRDGYGAGMANPNGRQGSLVNSNDMLIGISNPALATGAFKGWIDELTFYNRVLSTTECCTTALAREIGHCGRNEFYRMHCPGGLTKNGSFEDGVGSACGSSLGGLKDWFDSSATKESEWAGTKSGDCVSKEAKHCFDGTPAASEGSRFAFLDIDLKGNPFNPCAVREGESISQNMAAAVIAGKKYKYSMKVTRRGWGGSVCSERVDVHIGPDAIFSAASVPSPIRQWHTMTTTFTATAGMNNRKDLKIHAEHGKGMCIDDVCLMPLGGGTASGLWPCLPCACPGGGVFVDSTGLNSGLLIGGVAGFPGILGDALAFDGVTGFARIPDSPTLDYGTGDFTISLFVNPRVIAPGVAPLVAKYDAAPIGWFAYLLNGRPTITLADSSGMSTFSAPNPIPAGTFSQVAFAVWRTNRDGGLGIYVDGQLVGSFDPTVRPGSLDNAADVLVASATVTNGPTTSTVFFDGAIDEFEMYGAYLPADEIAAISAEGKPVLPDFTVTATPNVVLSATNPSQPIAVMITNNTARTGIYDVFVRGLDAADNPFGVEIDGTTMTFGITEAKVRPGTSTMVTLPVSMPTALVPGTRFRYEVIVWDRMTLSINSAYGEATNDGIVDVVGPMLPVTLRPGLVAAPTFNVTNISATAATIPYVLEVTSFDESRKTDVSVNGMQPGMRFTGSITIPAASSAAIPATVLLGANSAMSEAALVLTLNPPRSRGPVKSSVVLLP